MKKKRRRQRKDLPHQRFYAERELLRHGVNPGNVDLEALIDDTLEYRENRRKIVLPLIDQRTPTLKEFHAEAI